MAFPDTIRIERLELLAAIMLHTAPVAVRGAGGPAGARCGGARGVERAVRDFAVVVEVVRGRRSRDRSVAPCARPRQLPTCYSAWVVATTTPGMSYNWRLTRHGIVPRSCTGC
jgi:hypothetical protein